MNISLKQLKKLRCRLLERGTGQPLPAVVVHLSLPVDGETKGSLPVSTLRTDATGYVSFDLQPLIELGLDMVPAIHISAPQVGLKNHDVLDQLKGPANVDEMRTSYVPTRVQESGREPRSICIEFTIHADRPSAAQENSEGICRAAHLVSVQRPDLCDYELSPYSFVTPVKINLGGECCESLAPSTLPVQEHLFYRVVVRRIGSDETDSVETSIERSVEITENLPAGRPAIKFAEVLDYRQSWFAIGHSLGEIRYSLPLAPGESTQLAVIEWSRTDAASRFDSVTGKEDLTHWLNRDRAIEETIDAGLKESQGGWSWTGGLSSGMTYDAKLYGQYTGNWAAGGGTSNSWGRRNVEADSQQELHDTINQSTSYTRSLNSTVIVQAAQAEANNVRTRRVANHNHCHALTIQYYEVLRHFRLRTEFVDKRYAVLIPFSTFSFTRGVAIRFRTAIEQALTDRSLISYFDALVRLDLDIYEDQSPDSSGTPAVPKFFTGTLSGLVVDARSFPMYPQNNGASVMIEKGSTVHISARAQGNGIAFGGGRTYDVDGEPGQPAPDDGRWPMTGAQSFAFLAKIGPDFYQIGRDSTITAGNEGVLSLWFNDRFPLTDNSGNATAEVTVTPPPRSAPPDSEKVPDSVADPKKADRIKEAFLLKHLNANIGYYNRAIWILMDPVERRLYLEAALGSESDILAAIDDKPIAVSGNHVAFIYDGPLPFEIDDEVELEPLESIVTLPTRGLFAEAQLGHCNSCEKRDVTRMWDWTEMTTEEPPAISGIQPGPQGQMPAIAPSQLPSNVIQITQPLAAPDPTGLANALAVLRTPNIFRDMSGLDEASALLGKLADGTISTLAGMVNAASQAKGKVDAVRAGQSSASGSAPSGNTGPSAKDLADRFSLLPEIKSFAKDLGLTEDELKKFALDQIYGTTANTGSGGPAAGGTAPAAGIQAGGGGTAEGIPAGQLLSSSDAGVAPVIEAQRLTADVMAGINSDARLKESLDKLLSDGWDIRRTNIYFGNSSVDSERKIIYIDDDEEPVATTTKWVADAVRKAYQSDDDYRRKTIRDKAMTIFSAAGETDLEKMATVYEWAGWFWRYPTDDGSASGLMDDMMLVLTNVEPNGRSLNDKTYYIFAPGRLPDVGSTGFKYAFRDDSNQVRHATAAIQACLNGGPFGYAFMQLREDSNSADWRLNFECEVIGSGMRFTHPPVMPKNIGAGLRRHLGDPAQTGPWAGPAAGDPNVQPPW